MKIVLLLIASLPLFGQATCYTLSTNPERTVCDGTGATVSIPLPVTLPENCRVVANGGLICSNDARPKGTIKITVKGVPVKLKLREANQLLVELAKEINRASANSAMVGDPVKPR